jgi:hypothetical protein
MSNKFPTTIQLLQDEKQLGLLSFLPSRFAANTSPQHVFLIVSLFFCFLLFFLLRNNGFSSQQVYPLPSI